MIKIRFINQSKVYTQAKKFLKFPQGPLILIVFVAFVTRVYNLNYNSPFLDEAQYLVLGRKVLSGHWQEASPFSWVGGLPLFYPPLVAIFGFFGVVGARFLSVILGTASVYLIYEFAKSLKLSKQDNFNQKIGLISAALLGVLAIPIYLSRFAIYDMLSFSLFLAGLVFLQKGLLIEKPNLWDRENRFFIAASFFFLSFLAKYVTLVFFPFLVLWLVYNAWKISKETLLLGLKYFVTPLIIATLVYISWNFGELRHFYTDQVGDKQSSFNEILTRLKDYSLIPVILGLGGYLILIFRKRLITSSALIIATSIIPTVHIVTNSLPAVHQHSFLVLIFVLPLAAYLLADFSERLRTVGYVLLIIVVTGLFIFSQPYIRQLETSWQNTNSVMPHLKNSTTNHERVLSSEDDVTVLSLTNLKEQNIVGVFNFTYKDLSSNDAYRQALKDGYFDVVLFSEDGQNELTTIIKNELTNHYIPTYNSHPFVVYKQNVK